MEENEMRVLGKNAAGDYSQENVVAEEEDFVGVVVWLCDWAWLVVDEEIHFEGFRRNSMAGSGFQ